jgi:hypothetical protein
MGMRMVFTFTWGLIFAASTLEGSNDTQPGKDEHRKVPAAKIVLNRIEFTKPDWATDIRRRSDGSTVFSRELSKQEESKTSGPDAEQIAKLETTKCFPPLAGRLRTKGASLRTKETETSPGKWETRNDGYLVQFDVVLDGIPVWNDYVTVSVRNDKVEAISLRGHAIENVGEATKVIPIKEVVDKTKTAGIFGDVDLDLDKAELCYVDPGAIKATAREAEPQEFVLAWHVPVSERGQRRGKLHVWIEASSGRFLAKKAM